MGKKAFMRTNYLSKCFEFLQKQRAGSNHCRSRRQGFGSSKLVEAISELSITGSSRAVFCCGFSMLLVRLPVVFQECGYLYSCPFCFLILFCNLKHEICKNRCYCCFLLNGHLSGKELFIRKLLHVSLVNYLSEYSFYTSFPFGFGDRVWDLVYQLLIYQLLIYCTSKVNEKVGIFSFTFMYSKIRLLNQSCMQLCAVVGILILPQKRVL